MDTQLMHWRSIKLWINTPHVVMSAIIIAALLAPWIAPVNSYDLGAQRLHDAYTPPLARQTAHGPRYWLGSDGLGRDILSEILFGLRQSLLIASVAVFLSMIVGTGLGLAAGYAGGWLDAMIIRVSDIQSAIPPMLIAMLLYGLARPLVPPDALAALSLWLIIGAIALSEWALFARTVRAAVRAEKQKAYVATAVAIGCSHPRIALRHILPNVSTPIFVVATMSMPMAILTEATLSFLGVGLPADQPSLGTMISRGRSDIFSGAWWTIAFPAAVLSVVSLTINLIALQWQARRNDTV